ncbi:tRNA glutamyl-Q(34) synthetase GluQRS [Candidimonas humi]|uniref:Glutamyl-Q tRNA(Asp) synthetase n=1 Tax=Candidimonas humi TaxID=683355 RepID=A0ABV8NZ55_9BURK|nr:tRNA glutamyl-Q(34) synthetase GluQRS [Candidimonas humi]MBV6304346.1 tRNA glutamyl-Q(34) synthetase GluQRS [Candidimonas humi]
MISSANPAPRAGYTGRYAPSPSGPLHAGSLVAALASYLDARVHGGRWLLRIEDIDTPRSVAGADRIIMQQLQALGMHWDRPVVWQSQRHALYQQAFDRLAAQGLVYGCACTRREIEEAIREARLREQRFPERRLAEPKHAPAPVQEIADGPAAEATEARSAGLVQAQGRARPGEAGPGLAQSTPTAPEQSYSEQSYSERPYPGTCRDGLPSGREARAWRFRVPPGVEHYDDRWLGPQRQDVLEEVGDFVLRRADGLWAYQLAVVVDDAEQQVTDIVRGADLLGSTARQRLLARSLGLALPSVMHVPLVCDALGRKLSKQNHAPALDCSRPLQALETAWQHLGFAPLSATGPDDFWQRAQAQWAARYGPA